MQGMSTAAVGSLALDRALGCTLKESTAGPAGKTGSAQQNMRDVEGLRRLARSFQREWFKAVSIFWNIHTSEGMR